MKLNKMIAIIIFTIGIIFFTSCNNGISKEVDKPTEIEKETVHSIKTTRVEKKDVESYTSFNSKLKGFTEITVSSEVSGKIIKVSKSLGDYVKKGETICAVDNVEYEISLKQAEAKVMASEAAYEASKITMESSEKLYQSKNLSKLSYINDKSKLKTNKANLDGAKAELERSKKNYENSKFRSPVSGVITELFVNEGEYISQGKQVAFIVDAKKLKIEVGVGETEIVSIKKGQEVIIDYTPLNISKIGKITGKGIRPSGLTEKYPIEIVLDNKDGKLYSGMVIEGKIKKEVFKNVISIPIDYVIKEYDKYYSYVLQENKTVTKQEIKPYLKINRDYILSSGLNEGDEIIIEGIAKLSDGAKVNVVEDNM